MRPRRESVNPAWSPEVRPELFVTHVGIKLVFPQANANLFKATVRHLRVVASVAGGGGKPVHQVYADQ